MVTTGNLFCFIRQLDAFPCAEPRPWADADIRYYIQEYMQQYFSRLIKILSWRGMQVRYCGFGFKQLILISVFYCPDKMFFISPKQRMSDHYIAISEAGEHATEVACCKSVKVKHCLPQ
jgi:hypothetical protein